MVTSINVSMNRKVDDQKQSSTLWLLCKAKLKKLVREYKLFHEQIVSLVLSLIVKDPYKRGDKRTASGSRLISKQKMIIKSG